MIIVEGQGIKKKPKSYSLDRITGLKYKTIQNSSGRKSPVLAHDSTCRKNGWIFFDCGAGAVFMNARVVRDRNGHLGP